MAFHHFSILPLDLQYKILLDSDYGVVNARSLTTIFRQRALWDKIERDLLLPPTRNEMIEYLQTSPASVKIVAKFNVDYGTFIICYNYSILNDDNNFTIYVMSIANSAIEHIQYMENILHSNIEYFLGCINYDGIILHDLEAIRWVIQNRLVHYGLVEHVDKTVHTYFMQYIEQSKTLYMNDSALEFIYLFVNASMLQLITFEERERVKCISEFRCFNELKLFKADLKLRIKNYYFEETGLSYDI